VEAARYAWKRLSMMEDAMLMYKVTRSPQRYAFYVDVGDVPPNQARGLLNRIKNDFKKSKFIDERTGKPSFRYSPLCLSLDTRIPLLDGKVKTLNELIADHEAGIQNWTYSIDRETKNVVPGKISWAGITRKNASLVRVTLDNCRSELVTPDHNFMLRDGSYCEAQNLKPGMSLMPFNHGVDKKGYHYVVHPSCNGLKSFELTNRLVARNLIGEIKGLQVHHINGLKLDNHPSNLQIMTNSDHQKLHGHFARWNQSEQHSKNSVENNKKYNKSRFLLAYNKTEKHKADNAIRSANLKKKRAEEGEEFNKKLRLKFSDELRQALIELIQRMPDASIDSICEYIQKNEDSLSKFQEGNTRKVNSIHRHLVLKAIRSFGFSNYSDFKNHALHNHKVSAVEFLDYTEDTGCITVDEWHNFALDSGVFVKNSSEDDFFIPVRKERKGTEIEVLAGPEGQSVEDVEYFLNKIFAALKIPKSYLGADETVGRANLSQLDSRMCRSVMRIQREIKNGFRQIARVDLAAKNIDPDRTSFECHMVIPSGVFELAQIEVEKAKLDLASSYRDANFSQYWIYSKILGLSDEEILQIQKQRAKEAEGDITAEDVGLIHDRLPRMVERLSTDYDKRADRYQKKILDEIESGNTSVGRRLRELKHLTQDIKSGIARQTRVNGRRK
jgi:tRNA-splicing ligase RtcB